MCVCTYSNLNVEPALGFRVAFSKDKPHCFGKLTPNTTRLSPPLPGLKSVVCVDRQGWDFLLIRRAFGLRSGQK